MVIKAHYDLFKDQIPTSLSCIKPVGYWCLRNIFLADVIFDVFNYDLIKLHWVSHTQVEVVFTLCLGITLFFFVHNIRSLLKRQKKAETSVKVASGELSLVIQRYFEIWRLTPSETEVALLLFKGFSAQEIADLRSTKIGTVKNQSSVVYQKANVKNRNELFAIFVEDLLGDLGSSST